MMTWNTVAAQSFDFSSYQKILDGYLRENCQAEGIPFTGIDYQGLLENYKAPASAFRQQLDLLKNFSPQILEGRDEQIAFWINVYNIGVIKMVLDNWAVDSSEKSKNFAQEKFWKEKIITVGKRQYSLQEIKQDILLGRLKELLCHFVLISPWVSGPDLSTKVYTASSLQNRFSGMMVDPSQLGHQLRKQARVFLANEKKGLKIDRSTNTIFFSQIFQFDKKSFPDGARGAIHLIAPFVKSKENANYLLTGNYKIAYLDYNRKLNQVTW